MVVKRGRHRAARRGEAHTGRKEENEKKRKKRKGSIKSSGEKEQEPGRGKPSHARTHARTHTHTHTHTHAHTQTYTHLCALHGHVFHGGVGEVGRLEVVAESSKCTFSCRDAPNTVHGNVQKEGQSTHGCLQDLWRRCVAHKNLAQRWHKR